VRRDSGRARQRHCPRRLRGTLLLALAGLCAAVPLTQLANAAAGGSARASGPADPDTRLIAQGRRLFQESCSSCHGFDARGVSGQGPTLHGAGAGAADFYLRTGRMPFQDQPGSQPLRAQPRFPDRQIRALVAYAGSLGGPGIPRPHPGQGSLSEGTTLFTSSCAGCHAISGKGGVAIGAYAPPFGEATPTQVAEAVRTGPFVMPAFGPRQISNSQLDSIIRYVQLTQNPDDRGGWGIGHIGPVPEGLVAWALAVVALLLVARLTGERGGDPAPPEGER
jgi:ubiquinol-cytochrome c reductase cytochrome c subunit